MRIIRIIIIAEKVDLISSQDRDDDEKEGTGNSLCTREVGDEREVQEEKNNHNKGINT